MFVLFIAHRMSATIFADTAGPSSASISMLSTVIALTKNNNKIHFGHIHVKRGENTKYGWNVMSHKNSAEKWIEVCEKMFLILKINEAEHFVHFFFDKTIFTRHRQKMCHIYLAITTITTVMKIITDEPVRIILVFCEGRKL